MTAQECDVITQSDRLDSWLEPLKISLEITLREIVSWYGV